jgi:hypothetical protein
MIPPIDLTNQRFGRLRALRLGAKQGGRRAWECRCDCGETTTVRTDWLRRGLKRSCGCLQQESRGATQRTHGRTGTPEYKLWQGMIKRCVNPRCKSYANYGGRGIKVCERWRSDFAAFASDMGPRPKGGTLERRNNGGHYEPGNVVWATKEEQANNTRSNRLITSGGKTMTLARWAKVTGIGPSTIRFRLEAGWTPDLALTLPPVVGRNQSDSEGIHR